MTERSLAGDRVDPRGERRIGLIGQAVIVLDVVDAALRKAGGEVGKCGRRKSLRFERRAGKCADTCSRSRAQSLHAMTRTPKRQAQRRRQVDIPQDNIVMQRAVAEQNVQQLTRVVIDGRHGQRYGDLECARLHLMDGLHTPDDFVADKVVRDRRQWHLHALLDRQRIGPRVDRTRVTADAIDGS